MLAGELRLHGVRVLVLERDAEPPEQVRPPLGLHVRSIELMDRGDYWSGSGSGQAVPAAAASPESTSRPHRAWTPPTDTFWAFRRPHRGVAGRMGRRIGAEVRRGVAVVALGQDDPGVSVELADGTRYSARYLVGCDGGRSTVRKLLGVGFPGELSRGRDAGGRTGADRGPGEIARRRGGSQDPTAFRGDAARERAVPRRGAGDEARTAPFRRPLEEFTLHLRATAGTDFGRTHRAGCPASAIPDSPSATASAWCCLAGDAAHIHPPAGGQAQPRHPGRGQPGLEAGGRTRRLGTGRAGWTATTPSGTRWPPRCSTTPARRWRCCPRSRGRRRCAGSCQADGLRAGAPAPDRRSPPSGSVTTSARARVARPPATRRATRAWASLRVDARRPGPARRPDRAAVGGGLDGPRRSCRRRQRRTRRPAMLLRRTVTSHGPATSRPTSLGTCPPGSAPRGFDARGQPPLRTSSRKARTVASGVPAGNPPSPGR